MWGGGVGGVWLFGYSERRCGGRGSRLVDMCDERWKGGVGGGEMESNMI